MVIVAIIIAKHALHGFLMAGWTNHDDWWLGGEGLKIHDLIFMDPQPIFHY